MAELDLQQIAKDLVDKATSAGASAADVVALEGEEFSTVLRLGKIEKLKEASSKGLGLRVFIGTRSASAYSSDFSPSSLKMLVERTLEMARETSEDPASSLPSPELLGRYQGDLQLYCPDVAGLSTEDRIAWARRAEEAAMATDPRIRNSEGSWYESNVGTKVYATSAGFVGSYRGSFGSVAVSPIAQAEPGGAMERDYWYSVARSVAALEKPEAVGQKAAVRALRRLGARKISTRQVPVVFDAETASSLIGHIFGAVRGDAIYRKASFLTDKLGQQVAGENVTVLDDGLRPGGFGSRPFDDEGIPASTTTVIERGVLKSYLLNSYSANKLGLKTTGNASRGLAGAPSVGPKNLYLKPGTHSVEEIIRSVKDGFYVTELIGFGVNVVTGDYSRGAAGLWIENGELVYPVHEVTIAGSLQDMLNHIEMIGSDLEFRRSVTSPTLRVGGLTVAGA
jgi:PmbA protein